LLALSLFFRQLNMSELPEQRLSKENGGSLIHGMPKNVQQSRLGKVNRLAFPQEFQLTRFVENIENRDPYWNISTPACKWSGIICNEDEQIIEIKWLKEVILRELSGSLQWDFFPTTIHTFTAIGQTIWGTVQFNTLPSSMLSFTSLHSRFYGSLNICDLPRKLTKLEVGDNDFDGNINLSDLPPSMTYFSAWGNKLSGKANLANLPFAMKFLILANNNFDGTPELRYLPESLEELVLLNNDFSGVVHLHHLPKKLKLLNLEYNPYLGGEFDESLLPDSLQTFVYDETEITSMSK